MRWLYLYEISYFNPYSIANMFRTVIGVVLVILLAVIVFNTFSEKQEGVGNGCIAPGGRGKHTQPCCGGMATIVTQGTRFCATYRPNHHSPRENVSRIK